MDRFWSKVDKSGDCWEWTAYVDKAGYGNFKRNNRNGYVHRVSWELTNGEIPKGLCVLHHCDNRKCVNPDHLFLGTQYDNMQDMIEKGRKRPTYGSGHGMSKLTEEQVIEIRSRMRCGGDLQKNLAVEFGISKQLISCIVLRTRWTHI